MGGEVSGKAFRAMLSLMHFMDYELSFDHDRLDFNVIHGFLATSYWSEGIRRDIVEKAAANSMVVGCYVGAEQVGYARLVTDKATFAYLCDVFVLENHRGKGLAKAMVRALLNHPDLQSLRRWVLATRDAHELYRALGFSEVTPGRWMDLLPPPENWKDVSR